MGSREEEALPIKSKVMKNLRKREPLYRAFILGRCNTKESECCFVCDCVPLRAVGVCV